MKVPFHDVAVQYREHRDEIDAAVRGVLESGIYISGAEVVAFEQEFARYLGVAHVVSVNSGTDALLLSLRALGIGDGDEVIVPAYTFLATAQAVHLAGAAPRFADCGTDSFNVDVDSVASALTKKVKAVIPVHLFGMPVDLAPIQRFCDANRIHMIEDAAQATGARCGDRHVGNIGVAAAFSFYPTKNLGGCGDGGAISCNDEALAARLRHLRNHGFNDEGHVEPGINSRLDAMQAAILRVKLPHLDAWNVRRVALARRYEAALSGTRCRWLHDERDGRCSVFHRFVVVHPQRDALREFLSRNGVETAVYYETPCHLRAPFAHDPTRRTLPVAERWSREALALPLYPELSDAGVDRVIELVHRFEQG